MKIIQNLDNKVSKAVFPEDANMVHDLIKPMQKLLQEKQGIYSGGLALAHVQVEQTKPLRFYVLKDGSVIINPVIVNHTRHKVQHLEGCLSFYNTSQKIVDRYNKVTIEYQELITQAHKAELSGMSTMGGRGKWILTEVKTKQLSAIESKIAQHEIDHFNGRHIYDTEVYKKSDLIDVSLKEK